MLSKDKSIDLKELLSRNKLVPVAVFSDVNGGLKTAEVLLSNSINILEITLRTEAAFECISEIGKKYPDIVVGAGSVQSLDSLKKARACGARFCVAPGLDIELVRYASKKNILFIPGIATPSELNLALKSGCRFIKVFPAENLGGPEYIKAIAAPFRMRDFHLIPTGGINEANVSVYLKTDRVIACGASYIVDSKLLEKNDFSEIGLRIQKTQKAISN